MLSFVDSRTVKTVKMKKVTRTACARYAWVFSEIYCLYCPLSILACRTGCKGNHFFCKSQINSHLFLLLTRGTVSQTAIFFLWFRVKSPNISYLCTDECVSPSLESPNFKLGSIWRHRRQFTQVGCPSVHIDECLAILYEVWRMEQSTFRYIYKLVKYRQYVHFRRN